MDKEKKDYVTGAQKAIETGGMAVEDQVKWWSDKYNDAMNLIWSILSEKNQCQTVDLDFGTIIIANKIQKNG